MRFLKQYWPSMLTVAVVLYATLWPDPLPEDTPPLFPMADKLIHALLMGGIVSAVLFDRARAYGLAALKWRPRLTVMFAVAAFAVIDEAAQSLMGLGRQSDIFDLVADIAGCAGAAILAPPAIKKVLRLNRKANN